jgi:hypothetical protein
MSTLTLDVGGLALDVGCKKGGFALPDLVGAVLRSENGNARSFIRAELKNVPVILVDLDKATALTIRQLFAKGSHVVCNGEVFDNALADITVWGEITGEMIQGGTWWELSITLHEVSNDDTGLFVVDTTPSVSTLVNWYDAQGPNLAALSPVDLTALVTWPDETANGFDATSGNPSFTGEYQSATMNGHPCVAFAPMGNNQRGYDLPNDFSPTEGEAFVVMRAGTDGGPFWMFGEITTGPYLPDTIGATFRDDFGSTTARSFAMPIDPTAPFLYHVRSRAGQFRAWINGTLVYSSAINAQVWPPVQHLGIWLSGGAIYQPATLYLGEVKLFQGFKSPTDAAIEEAAIMTKWGIT